MVQNQVNEKLLLEQYTSIQLQQQLESEKSRRLRQDAALASSDSEMQMLGENLAQEKQRLKELHLALNKDQVAMANIERELKQKKSELVKNKRALAQTNQALRAKSRNLTISEGQNTSLNQKISTLSQ